MSFLSELNRCNKIDEAEDLSELPYDVYHELENHIRNGAKDMDKQVKNALSLVKEAYKVENVELPHPAMKKAWEQFSTLIEYATANLLKYRGVDGEWRISAYQFRESIETQKTYAVTIRHGDEIEQSKINSPDKASLVEYLTNELTDGELSPIITEEGNQIKIGFRRMNVRQNIVVTLTEI